MHNRLPPAFEDLPAAEALRASEERFRRLAETAGAGILTIDEASTILFANQAVERMFGYSAEELYGQPLTLLMPAALRERHSTAMGRYLATGEKTLRWAGTEFKARHKDGAELPVEVSFGEFTAGGRRFFTGFVRDVREQRRARRELERQRALLDSLIEAAPLAIITMDPHGRVESWNLAAERLFGWKAEEVVGGPYPLVPPGKEQEYTGIVSESLAGRQGVGYETQRRRRDGSLVDVAISTAAVRGADGQIVTLIGLFEDIGGRKRAEEDRRRSDALYRALVNSVPDVFWVSDAEGNSTFVSPNVEQVYGFTPAEVIDAGAALWFGRVHPEDLARVRDAYARFIDGEGPFDLDYRLRRRDDRWIWVHDRAVSHHEKDGKTWVYGVFSDVTARHRAADALRAQREELRSLSERLRALSARLLQVREDERAAMSREIHDQVGQALIGLRYHIAALRQTPPVNDAALRGKLAELMAITDSTMITVRDLAAELRPVVLDSLGLAAAVEWQAREVARRSGVKIDIDLHIGALWPRRELSTAVFRCLQEALTNVERHAGANAVRVSLAADRDLLVLEVQDDGRGIRPEEIRGPASLGLLGMRERAAAFGGEVLVRGEPGKGTLLRVEVPLGEADRGGGE